MTNIDLSKFKVAADNDLVQVSDYSTKNTSGLDDDALKKLTKHVIHEIDDLQNILYAENRRALLIIMQGMDAAGKDSAIREIMTGVNPQGVEVHSFKKPTTNELEHDFLWRHYVKLPERGKIAIFNRSHYENVLVTKVHPEFLMSEKLPDVYSPQDATDAFWKKRYEQINNFEKTITQNGVKIIKFMLNVSKEEQKKRFINRIENKEKNWKFSSADIQERKYWDQYMVAFDEVLSHTSTQQCPWYVIPCDDKKFAQYLMASLIAETLKKMNPQFPEVSQEEEADLQKAYLELQKE